MISSSTAWTPSARTSYNSEPYKAKFSPYETSSSKLGEWYNEKRDAATRGDAPRFSTPPDCLPRSPSKKPGGLPADVLSVSAKPVDGWVWR